MKGWTVIISALLIALCMTACLGEGLVIEAEDAENELVISADGEWTEFPVILQHASEALESVAWSSSQPEIVEVDESGHVRGLQPGEAVITCECLTRPEASVSLLIICVPQEESTFGG